jgi:alpha-D-ribose 1-methylphosphonate 5-triphosphate synthase subunit PhnG
MISRTKTYRAALAALADALVQQSAVQITDLEDVAYDLTVLLERRHSAWFDQRRARAGILPRGAPVHG